MQQERRQGYKDLAEKLDMVMERQGKIKSYLETLFGGEDLVGTPVEGSVNKQLRELNDKVKTQNGRVGKLEEVKNFWWAYVLGVSAVIGIIFSILGLAASWFK